MISLQQLRERGGFVDTKPVPKEISWIDEDGEEFKGNIFVVRQPFGVVEAALVDPDKDRSQSARLIALQVRLGTDASECLSYEDAFNLNAAVAWAMVRAINEVNAPRTRAR